VLDGVLPAALCQELLLVARSLAVVGYRPGVCSSTIFEVATAAPALLPPLVRPPRCLLRPALLQQPSATVRSLLSAEFR
jgi:hypothetical protein